MRTGHAGIHRRFQRTGSCWSSDCLADGTDCLEHRGYRAQSEAFQRTQLDVEQQKTVQNEIIGLAKRKYAEFPNLRTAIRDFSVLLVGGVPHIKARPGDTFPEIPFPEFDEPESEPETGSDVTPDIVRTLRKRMKLTQIQFGEIFGISSKKVSAWEHDKAAPSEEQKQKIQSLLKENNG